jgi:hypothetical protein
VIKKKEYTRPTPSRRSTQEFEIFHFLHVIMLLLFLLFLLSGSFSGRLPALRLGCWAAKHFNNFITAYELSISIHVKQYCVDKDKPYVVLK